MAGSMQLWYFLKNSVFSQNCDKIFVGVWICKYAAVALAAKTASPPRCQSRATGALTCNNSITISIKKYQFNRQLKFYFNDLWGYLVCWNFFCQEKKTFFKIDFFENTVAGFLLGAAIWLLQDNELWILFVKYSLNIH